MANEANYGRIAIIPKGDFAGDVQYEAGDVVSYQGSSYLAFSKPPLATLPTDINYWQVSAKGFDAEKAENITAEDPQELGFENVQEFINTASEHIKNTENPHRVTAEQVGAQLAIRVPFDTSIYSTVEEWARANISIKQPIISTSWNGYNTSDCPYTHWGMLYALGHTKGNGITVILKLNGNYVPYIRSLHAINDGWIEDNWTTGYLPLTGGTLSGPLTIYSAIRGLTVNRDISYNNEVAKYNTIVSPSVLKLNNKYTSAMTLGKNDTTISHLLLGEDGVGFALEGSVVKHLFGEHNKPTGTYTGNGDATARTIDTGGIGKCVLICSTAGMVIAYPTGGLSCRATDNTIYRLGNGNCNFDNNILTIASTDAVINASGITYTYQVL